MSILDIVLCIAGMTAVTLLPRVLPITLLAGRKLPPLLTTWLSFVPVTVLSALLVPDLLLTDGSLNISLDNKFLVAALPTLIVCWRTKSLFAALAVGMTTVALLRHFWS